MKYVCMSGQEYLHHVLHFVMIRFLLFFQDITVDKHKIDLKAQCVLRFK